MRSRHNRLTTSTDSVVAVKADTNFRSALNYLIEKYGARNQAEIIYQSVFLLANNLGFKSSLGGLLPTLEHLLEEERESRNSDYVEKLSESVVTGKISPTLTQKMRTRLEETVVK